jgi:sugar O-acyltransferase (sialic acid O-acetyltransferase NeuD family)
VPSDLPGLARRHGIDGVALGVGDNYAREVKFREVVRAGLRPICVIHPSARISRFAKLGEGVVIMAGAVVNPGTVIEDNVCVNTSASVDHDNMLERCCHVFPNATLTGGVRIGAFTIVGSGAVVSPYLTIGKYSYVGAGAVVIRDVGEGLTVAGVPARTIKKQENRPG